MDKRVDCRPVDPSRPPPRLWRTSWLLAISCAVSPTPASDDGEKERSGIPNKRGGGGDRFGNYLCIAPMFSTHRLKIHQTYYQNFEV